MEGSEFANFVSCREPALADALAKLRDCHQSKQYNSLQQQLRAFVSHSDFQKYPLFFRKQFYDDFLRHNSVDLCLKPLALVNTLGFIVRKSSYPSDAIQLVDQIKPRVNTCKDALVMCNVLKAEIMVIEMASPERARQIIQELRHYFGKNGMSALHQRFYFMTSEFHRLQKNYDRYYHDAIQHLNTLRIPEESTMTLAQCAFLLGIAVILSMLIFNFSELLVHPAMNALRGTSKSWMVDLLVAFNRGDLDEFEKLRGSWGTVLDLACKEEQMKTKISAMCLVRMLQRRPSSDLNVTFQEISKELRTSSEVEATMFVWKAHNWNLITADIDYDRGIVSVRAIHADNDVCKYSVGLLHLNNLMSDTLKDKVKTRNMMSGILE